MSEAIMTVIARIEDIGLECDCGAEFSVSWRSDTQQLSPSKCPGCGKDLKA